MCGPLCGERVANNWGFSYKLEEVKRRTTVYTLQEKMKQQPIPPRFNIRSVLTPRFDFLIPLQSSNNSDKLLASPHFLSLQPIRSTRASNSGSKSVDFRYHFLRLFQETARSASHLYTCSGERMFYLINFIIKRGLLPCRPSGGLIENSLQY